MLRDVLGLVLVDSDCAAVPRLLEGCFLSWGTAEEEVFGDEYARCADVVLCGIGVWLLLGVRLVDGAGPFEEDSAVSCFPLTDRKSASSLAGMVEV